MSPPLKVDFTHYAGFWRRTVAALIDTILFLIIAAFIHYLFFSESMEMIAVSTDNTFNFQAATSINWTEQLIIIGITIFMWMKFLGTPGKLILGCHILDLKTRQAISPSQALLRYFGYFVSVIPFMLGFIWVGIDKRKQGFHDKIAGTVVIVSFNMNDGGKNDDSQKPLSELMDETKHG